MFHTVLQVAIPVLVLVLAYASVKFGYIMHDYKLFLDEDGTPEEYVSDSNGFKLTGYLFLTVLLFCGAVTLIWTYGNLNA